MDGGRPKHQLCAFRGARTREMRKYDYKTYYKSSSLYSQSKLNICDTEKPGAAITRLCHKTTRKHAHAGASLCWHSELRVSFRSPLTPGLQRVQPSHARRGVRVSALPVSTKPPAARRLRSGGAHACRNTKPQHTPSEHPPSARTCRNGRPDHAPRRPHHTETRNENIPRDANEPNRRSIAAASTPNIASRRCMIHRRRRGRCPGPLRAASGSRGAHLSRR